MTPDEGACQVGKETGWTAGILPAWRGRANLGKGFEYRITMVLSMDNQASSGSTVGRAASGMKLWRTPLDVDKFSIVNHKDRFEVPVAVSVHCGITLSH